MKRLDKLEDKELEQEDGEEEEEEEEEKKTKRKKTTITVNSSSRSTTTTTTTAIINNNQKSKTTEVTDRPVFPDHPSIQYPRHLNKLSTTTATFFFPATLTSMGPTFIISSTNSTTFNNKPRGTNSLGSGSGASGDEYDAKGAMDYIVVTMLVYALLGILSLLLVRIVRRAKLRSNNGHCQLRVEELNSVRSYIREQPRLQMQGRRQKLMHQKIRTAITLWKTDIPALSQPLLNPPTAPPQHPSHTVRTEYAPHYTEVLLHYHHRHHSNCSHKDECEGELDQSENGTHEVRIDHYHQQEKETILEIESNNEQEAENRDICEGQFNNQRKSHKSGPENIHGVRINHQQQTETTLEVQSDDNKEEEHRDICQSQFNNQRKENRFKGESRQIGLENNRNVQLKQPSTTNGNHI